MAPKTRSDSSKSPSTSSSDGDGGHSKPHTVKPTSTSLLPKPGKASLPDGACTNSRSIGGGGDVPGHNFDRRLTVFKISLKLFISILLLVFCCIQIIRDSDGCSNSLLTWYCSIIGIIVTAWIKGGKAENAKDE